jgi:phosphotriesterase-related protein
VAATGRHRAVHHDPAEAGRDVDELTQLFVDDITAPTRPCGLIKVGTGYHHLDDVERVSLEAAAAAHRSTGVPVAVHLELGTGADLVLGHLDEHQVPAGSIVLGHLGRHPDSGYLREVAAAGTFLCFDGPSRANHHTDWRTPELIERLAGDGHLDQLLIGGDTTTAAARSVTSGPGMPGLLREFHQSIVRRIGAPAGQAITVTNPARAFARRP